VSAATLSPVPSDAGIPPHRLTNDEAEGIAARVPWKAEDLVPWLRVLYVRAVDAGRPWVESYLTEAERTAIRAAIEDSDREGRP
jgi:hypothetical protein